MARMAPVELHIIVTGCDLDTLGPLVKAAVAAQAESEGDREVKMVPAGYRCDECYSDDGSHAVTCDIGAQAKKRQGARS